jgi:hypothetical protein
MELPNKIELDNLECLKTVNQYRNAVNINKNKILSFYENLETKKFLLHILLRAQINWTINSSIFDKFRSAYNAVAFWENNQSEDVSKLNEVQLIQNEEAKVNSLSPDQEKVEPKGSLNRFTP